MHNTYNACAEFKDSFSQSVCVHIAFYDFLQYFYIGIQFTYRPCCIWCVELCNEAHGQFILSPMCFDTHYNMEICYQ